LDVEVARAETARLIYDEGRRLRELQDRRVDDIRQRSITVLSLVSSAVVIVAGLADEGVLGGRPLAIAAAAVVLMILSGVIVQVPQGGYNEGPNINQLVEIQYAEAHPGHQVLRDLGCYHYSHYRANNRGVLKWMHRGFAAELVFAAAAVVAVLAGVTF
jgi:hypothetical protein